MKADRSQLNWGVRQTDGESVVKCKALLVILFTSACARSVEETRSTLPVQTGTRGATNLAPEPYIRGVITSRDPLRMGVKDQAGQLHIVSIPQMLVAEDSSSNSPFLALGRRRGRIWLAFDSTTCVVNREGKKIPTDSLTVGRRVAAWVSENILTSYPPQGGATKVVIDDIIEAPVTASVSHACL